MDARHPKYTKLMLTVLIGICALADAVPAQELGLFRLRGLGGSLRFRYQSERKLVPSASRERAFNGILVIRNSGFIINPEIFNFKWSGDLSFFLEQLRAEAINRNSRGRFLGHNFTASLFRSSPTSLVFVWTRNANVINLDNLGRNNFDINSLQATLEMRGLKLPSRLRVAWRDLREEWDRAIFKTTRNQLRRSLNYSGNKKDDDSSFDVEYDFINISDRARRASSYSRHTANARYHRAFGKEQANSWNSEFRTFIRNGLSDRQNARFSQLLELQHLPSLSTRYRQSVSFTHATSGTFLQNSGSASLSHTLWGSLSSNAALAGSYTTMQQGETSTGSISGGISYTKRIPLSGRVQIGYVRGYSVNDLQIEPTERAVVNERHAFLGGLPIFLNERNIITPTIIVFNEQGDFIFEEGEDKDYTIRILGDRVEINRNPLGRITEGETILVDYDFLTLPAMRYSTDSKVFNAGLNFRWIGLSYYVNSHDQKLLKGDPEAVPPLQDLFTKGVRLTMTGRKDNLGTSLFAERKYYESTSLSFKAWDIRYAFFLKPFTSLTLSNNFTFSLLNHNRQTLDVRTYALRSELRWRPSRALILHGYGRYNVRQETLKADENNFEYGIRLERFWRVFRLLLMFDKRKWNFGTQHINERRFTIEIERVF